MGRVAAALRVLFHTSSLEALPPHVRARVDQQQATGEVVVGWIQLGVVLFLGLLYAISPKTFAADTTIEPVPWTIAGYAAFTVGRLVVAHRGRLPRWLSMLSCVVDVALLLLLIWSFHIQYEQPPAFVLKTPTLFYVFVFIALRTLLLEPRLALLTGVTGAGGWLLVVGLVLGTDAREHVVTRSYVEYLTSNRLLVGAELDKIVAILLATGLLVVAMVRARTLLIRSVAEEGRARDLGRFFSPEVAERITAGQLELVPGRGDAREAAILYVDIGNFTAMAADMRADALIALLAEYQARLVPSILAQGGTAEKYLGDGMVAAFGAVLARATYAADALRAGDGILASTDAWNRERAAAGRPPVEVRIAVTAGRVAVGAVGGEARLEYAVVGHPVNLAAKLEKHAKVEEARALCTREVWERGRAQGYTSAAPPEVRAARVVAGVPEPLDLVVLARRHAP